MKLIITLKLLKKKFVNKKNKIADNKKNLLINQVLVILYHLKFLEFRVIS